MSAAAGCAGGPGADWCAGNAMIVLTPHDVDVLSQDAVDRILEHNERGALECGWEAPGDA